MTKIKICGLKRECDIEYVNELKPDYIGFVFANSRRKIDETKANELKQKLDKSIKAVGVFVNDDIERVANISNNSIIDIIQLHGAEDESYICNLRKLTNKKIIKAYSINSIQDIEYAEKSLADYILLDNGAGGTGKNFNWKNLKDIKRDYFLAGGINESNLKTALEYNSFAVDLSSGVETDGFKDYDKIKNVIDIIRNGERI